MNRTTISFFFFSLISLLCGSSCQQKLSGPFPEKSKLVITGSSTIAPLVSEMAKRFESQNPGKRIDVQTGGSSRGIADIKQGLADIGMVSRSPKAEEGKLNWFPLARDGVCIIVHKTNSINSLSDDQVRAIFIGNINNWAQVGGADKPISVVNKAAGRSTLEVFLNHFQLNSSDVRAHVIIGDNQHGIKTVAGNPNAIGYVSVGAAGYEAKLGTSIKLLRSGSVTATIEHVKDGSFPISRTLHLITKLRPNGIQKEFIEFCQSELVVDLIQEQFFVQIAAR